MVGEKCAIILVAILYLSTIQAFDLDCRFGNESTAELTFGSTINENYRTYSSSDDFIECTNETHIDANTIPSNFFTSNTARLKTESVSEIQVRGTFYELLFESPFNWLSTLRIASANLRIFDLSKYEGNSRLKVVHLSHLVYSLAQVLVKLNSTQHLDYLILDDIYWVVIECASLKASKLKALTTSNAFLAGFNFGCLPQEIETLELIHSMTLSHRYHGLAPVKNLTNLKILNFKANELSSFDLSKLPASVIELDLSSNNLESFATIPLKGLFNLEVLNLANNLLISFNLTDLPASIVELDLSYNNKLESLETLPLKRLLHLKTLKLRDNGLKSFNLTHLPASVTDLYLGYNILESLDTLPLKGLSNLKTLNLANNAYLIPSGLNSFNVKNLPASVTHLDLSWHHLNYFDVESLPLGIKYLNLMYCGLTIDTSLFRPYTQLELLYLSGNKDVNGNSLYFYYDSNLQKLFGSNVGGAADPNTTTVPNTGDEILVNTTDGVAPTTSSSNNSTDNDDDKVDTDEDSCARNHVFMPLIVVICVRLFVTFL